ncbi:hypothetical protein UlMin_022382 [Ulmus minor]
MAIYHSELGSLSSPHFLRRELLPFGCTTTSLLPQRIKSHFPIQTIASKRHFLRTPNSASNRRFSAPKIVDEGDGTPGLPEVIGNWVRFVGSVFPGGSWWSLCDSEHEEKQFAAAKPVTVWFALRRMWELVGEDRWIVFVAIGGLIIAALSEISMPSILAASVFSAQRGETAVFLRNSKLLALLCVSSGICSGIRSGCFGVANVILVRRLRETVYSVLVFQDVSFFDGEAVGDLTSRLGADCQLLSNVIGNNINYILRNTLQGTGALINLLMLSWPLALSALVICSVLSTIFIVYGQYQKMAAKLTQDFTAGANEVAQETLSLIRTVRIYGSERKEQGRFKKWLEKIVFISLRESVAYGIWNLSFNTLYRSTQIFAVLVGGILILKGHLSPEQLTKYVLYCEWLIYATWRLTDSVSSLLRSVGASAEVFRLMDLAPSNQFLSKGVKLQRLMGHIKFLDLSFHYPSRIKVPVLDHVNLSVQPNEVVAIVGLSGSGKSTLMNLLLRLYEPTHGQIYIDGFPLRELDISWLRGRIGFVEQEPHLFQMDIRSNIKYGCYEDIKQEDIELAAKQAHAHGFIASLPDGYETLVDDNLLSGGQKQRIAIARAILRKPSILILDEATSALDSESEHYVKEVLHGFKTDTKASRTVIVIAHRLSTIRAADRIVVMDSGRVIEMGKHAELVVKDGLYAKLIRTQSDDLA